MATIDSAAREVAFKVVFYGPPGSGKATNLHYLHAQMEAESRSEIRRSNSSNDKLFSFSFAPGKVTLLDRFQPRIQLAALTGPVTFNAARELLLRDIDGVIFVANSEWDAMPANVASFENLRENLARQNVESAELPCVLQFNKRDGANIAPRAYLDFIFSHGHAPLPGFEASALAGRNVFATLNGLLQLIFDDFTRRHSRSARPARPPLKQVA